MYRFAFLLALGGALLGTSSAAAQGWLSDRSRAQGPGFRLGNLELHPGIGVEGGYDQNLFYEDADTDAAAILRITAHLFLSTITAARTEDGEADGTDAPNLRFTAGVAASYYHFFTDRAGDNVSVDGSFDLTINPEGRFVFRIYDTVGRSIRPFADAPPEGQAPLYARVQNAAGVDLTIQSPGQTLGATFSYRLDLDYFEDDNFDYLNSLTHVVSAAVNWRFFPNTALISRTDILFQNYLGPRTSGVGAEISDNRRVNSWLGVNGAFTQTLSFTAMVGYGVGFYELSDDFNNILAHLELKYKPRNTLDFSLGYQRLINPSFIGNFTRSDKIYLRGQVLAGGSFLLGAQLAVSFDRSGLARDPDGNALGNEDYRSDTRLNATVFGEYRFTEWLALNASVGYTGDFTDFQFLDPATGAVYPDAPAGFSKFEAWLGLRVFY